MASLLFTHNSYIIIEDDLTGPQCNKRKCILNHCLF